MRLTKGRKHTLSDFLLRHYQEDRYALKAEPAQSQSLLCNHNGRCDSGLWAIPSTASYSLLPVVLFYVARNLYRPGYEQRDRSFRRESDCERSRITKALCLIGTPKYVSTTFATVTTLSWLCGTFFYLFFSSSPFRFLSKPQL